ncbi:MAG: amino acid adenylation domain-containing protein, partial [Anaerolineales bacterium]|nr:amino acid adenylation domain-containing protein [Anaerolineales bacterium]
SGDWVDSLRALCEKYDTSLDVVLLSAFNTLIHRYTGQTDFLTGVTIKNRSRPETWGMIGPLINTLVHRTQLSDTEPFTDLLMRTAEINQAECEHQEFPYEILVHEFQKERDLSRNALAQVMFEFDNPPPVRLELSGIKAERIDLKETSTHFDLSLCMYEDGSDLCGGFQYSADLFDPATIERLAANFETMLQSIAADPSQKLFELPIMTAAEQHQIVVEWNQSEKAVPVEKRVHELFEEHAAQHPDRIAAAFQEQEITYDELNKRANKLSHQLLERGIQAETVIGILADRSIDFLVCILGIFKAGGAYVPIDPAYPPQRVRHMLTQSRAAMILGEQRYLPLAEEALEDQPKANRPQLVAFEDILHRDADDSNPGIEVGPEQLAYVIFTSGSTGLPKGAMVEHRGMLNHIYAKMYDLGLTENDVIAQNASQCFDISVWQFLEALVFGGKTQIYEDEIAHAPKYLLEKVEEHGVTILETVPSIMRTMVEAIADEPDRPRLQSLRWMIPTGEALPPSLAREWLKSYPNIPLLNAYGPTECSDDVTHYAVYEPPPLEVVNMPIGRPIANMHLYVLDTHLQPVPIGVMGEVYVGGIGVGQGYIYDQERTDKAFMADPFLDDPEARFYKTGDLGRWLPNGNIEYLGRVDFQVKVRGLRIELSEIDVAIEKHPDVREVVTTVYKTPTGGHQYLVSYLVATSSPPPGVEDLRSFLMERLPEYMVPPIYVFLDEMPLTSNGKIDRKALPAPEVARLSEDAYIAPRNAAEEHMAAIWSTALGIEQIGVRDNFFDLGGHSLLAVRLFARIEKEFGKRLPLATLYQAPTIEALAALVEQDGVSSEVWSPIVKINPLGSRNPFFCVGGNVIEVRNVSRHLGEDQPFYMLHWQGLNTDQMMTAGVQEVADAFIKEVRKVQPHGPYSLGGVFASGVVAVEMARQFYEAGEEVETLAIFNTLPTIEKSKSTGERTKSRVR